jgi:hypothetical protein
MLMPRTFRAGSGDGRVGGVVPRDWRCVSLPGTVIVSISSDGKLRWFLELHAVASPMLLEEPCGGRRVLLLTAVVLPLVFVIVLTLVKQLAR